MAQGLIAAALGGFGKALSNIGEMEAKKQNEAKLRKELMDMESEERLRLDEVMFQRKQERAIPEAETAARADVAGRSLRMSEEDKVNLPAREVERDVTKEKLKVEQRLKQNLPELTAAFDVATESAKLNAEETTNMAERRAKAKVGGEKAEILAAGAANLPEVRAEIESRKAKAQLDSDIKLGIPEAQAAYKVLQRIEELKAADLKNLSGEEAKAKYAALKADIDEAKRTKYWDSYYEQEANKKLAELEAILKAKVPEAQAKVIATERKELAGALVKTGTLKSEAVAGAEKRLEEVRAQLDKDIPKLEGELLARQEVAKIQAMTAQGVPEAEARLLAAKWKAQKAQRDEAAAEKTQQEMQDLITKMQNPKYKKALRAKEAIDATGGLILQANRDAKDRKDRERNTIEMERQIKETEKEMGRILGIGDPKKIPDELGYLEAQAKKGNADAAAKLAKVKPLVDELNSLSKELRTYKRGGSNTSSSSGSDTYRVGEERILSDGANKGKTVVWDGRQWNLKK